MKNFSTVPSFFLAIYYQRVGNTKNFGWGAKPDLQPALQFNLQIDKWLNV